ncbi:MAG: hypothetical protein WD176_07405, partial [Pirellulales bacterium]
GFQPATAVLGSGDSLLPMAQAIEARAQGYLLDYDAAPEGSGTFERDTARSADGREVVLLFDWAGASNELSHGWTEAAGDAIFNLLVGLDLVDLA